MNVSSIGQPPVPNPSVDYHDIAQVHQELMRVADTLNGMVRDVAAARTCKEFNSDQRKRKLAQAVVPFLNDGMAAGAAEHQARADKVYASAMLDLKADYEWAEEVLAREAALKARHDSLRSIASGLRAAAGL